MTISCIVLAAGRGSRFGAQKLLARMASGASVAEATIASLRPAFDRVLAVVSENDELIRVFQRSGVETIVNPQPERGMGSSLACGIAASSEEEGVVIALADMPFVRPETFAAVRAALAVRRGIVVPRFQEKRGHPVGFDRAFFSALASLQGNVGARAIIDATQHAVTFLDVDDPGILQDIDTMADLQRLQVGLANP